MSMQCCGYVVEWNVLKKHIDIDIAEKVDSILDEQDEWSANEYLTTLPKNTVPKFELFTPYEECNLENMEVGVTYAVFEEDTLYEKKRTQILEELQKKKIYPEFEMWTIWG